MITQVDAFRERLAIKQNDKDQGDVWDESTLMTNWLIVSKDREDALVLTKKLEKALMPCRN